jgi:acyl-CoA reductase-like NAD-dependent aldehyde dehydrogenase
VVVVVDALVRVQAHKVAPAIAAGCPFVLKPSDRTPLTAVLLGHILAETDLPDGSFSVLPCKTEHAALISGDSRVKVLSFTGSPAVGWMLKETSGTKKVILELGGNAGCIVDKDADIDRAVERILFGAFYYAGQVCISVQVRCSLTDSLTH